MKNPIVAITAGLLSIIIVAVLVASGDFATWANVLMVVFLVAFLGGLVYQLFGRGS